jgi:hypothetical protein
MPTRINNGSPPWAHLCLRFLAASRCLRQYFFSAALIARFCDGFIFSDGFICYLRGGSATTFIARGAIRPKRISAGFGTKSA